MASFFSSVQRVTSTFCALRQLMHIYQFYHIYLVFHFQRIQSVQHEVKKRPPFYIFRHYATYRKLRKKFKKKSEFFFSIFSFLRAFVVSSCRKSGFRVFLSLRYGADLGRSRLVSFFFVRPQTSSRMYHFLQKLIKLLRLLRPSAANANSVQRVPLFILNLFYVTYKTRRD